MSPRTHRGIDPQLGATKPLHDEPVRKSGSSQSSRKKARQAGEQAKVFEERRRYPRVWIALPVRYAPRQYALDVPPELHEAKTVNISRSGMALEVSHRLHRGGLIELAILQNNPPGCVDVVGTVTRCEPLHSSDASLPDLNPPRYVVAVKFTRLLSLRELRTLHQTAMLEAL
jgi:hypothetical protein